MEESIQKNEISEAVPRDDQPETPQQAPIPVDERQERNWRAARQEIAELRRRDAEFSRRDQEREQLLKQALEFQKNQQTQEEPEPSADDYINYDGVKKTASKVVQPLLKKVESLEQQLAIQKQKELMNSFKVKYPDFDSVVNAKTLELFEEKEPELAGVISEMRDPYKMGVQTYKYIKALNLEKDMPERIHQKEAAKKIAENESMLQSPQAIEKRPMAKAFSMSQDRSKLYEEMMHYASMSGFSPPMG